jgi:hypothetical protein
MSMKGFGVVVAYIGFHVPATRTLREVGGDWEHKNKLKVRLGVALSEKHSCCVTGYICCGVKPKTFCWCWKHKSTRTRSMCSWGVSHMYELCVVSSHLTRVQQEGVCVMMRSLMRLHTCYHVSHSA